MLNAQPQSPITTGVAFATPSRVVPSPHHVRRALRQLAAAGSSTPPSSNPARPSRKQTPDVDGGGFTTHRGDRVYEVNIDALLGLAVVWTRPVSPAKPRADDAEHPPPANEAEPSVGDEDLFRDLRAQLRPDPTPSSGAAVRSDALPAFAPQEPSRDQGKGDPTPTPGSVRAFPDASATERQIMDDRGRPIIDGVSSFDPGSPSENYSESRAGFERLEDQRPPAAPVASETPPSAIVSVGPHNGAPSLPETLEREKEETLSHAVADARTATEQARAVAALLDATLGRWHGPHWRGKGS